MRRRRFRFAIAFGLAAAALAGVMVPAAAQWGGGRWRGEQRYLPERDIWPGNKFTFCRLQYDSYGYGRRGGGRWATDWPEADVNFSIRLAELTTLTIDHETNGDPKVAVVRATDPELFHYPFLYMVEVGDLAFTELEAENIRNYMLRGGFIMVDDFWGQDEWNNWEYAFMQIFPPEKYPYRMVRIPLDHPIYNMVFPIKEAPQVPSINTWERTGMTYERRDAAQVNIMGVTDEKGRLMMIVCHNTDLGDAWEREGISPDYFEEFSVKKSYPMGINIVVYAMTH